MAIIIQHTNYSGEVLEQLLTTVMTTNQVVEKRMINIIPGVQHKKYIPRIMTDKVLQKRKKMPTEGDAKGNIKYSERELEPKDFMAFTTFDPSVLEHIWRKWQPKGNLVFNDLPEEVKEQLLAALNKQVQFEIGDHLINGVHGAGDNELFDGLVTRILSSTKSIKVNTQETTMIGRLKAIYTQTPKALREAPGFRIIMSTTDWDKYDDELSALPSKGRDYTTTNVRRFKDIEIVNLSLWPENLIVATIATDGINTNFWGACNLQDDPDVVQVEKLSPAGELYFYKVLAKLDTNIAFEEELVVLDKRTSKTEFIVADQTAVSLPVEGGSVIVGVRASGDYTVGGTHTGFTVAIVEGGVQISAEKTATDRTGKIELNLTGSSTGKKAIIEVSQFDGK